MDATIEDRGQHDGAAAIDRLLLRCELAGARRRAALGRTLGLGETEILAVAHLSRHEELTPSRLAVLLDLSSGGTTAVLQRLALGGHVTRHPHPRDGRSCILRLTPGTRARMAAVHGAAAALATSLDEAARATVTAFLAAVAAASEEQADRASQACEPRLRSAAPAVPSLWA